MDFLETIAASDLKDGRCRQLIEIMKLKVKVISLPYIFQVCMFCALQCQDIGWAFTGSLVLLFAYVKTKMHISFAVTAKLISVFVFVTQIVQSLFFLNRNSKPLAIICKCRVWFVLDHVGNPNVIFLRTRLNYFLCMRTPKVQIRLCTSRQNNNFLISMFSLVST